MVTPDSPVLVVGGRTTGLMMAAELARHGAPVRIIDASPGIDPHSRATFLHSRTLEILDELGIADGIVATGQVMRRILLFSNGNLVGTSVEDAVDSAFPNGMALSQAETEAILEQHLNRFGVAVERNTRLTAFEQNAAGVRATIEHADGADETVETPWLVGCDGAHSTVRHQSDEAFAGLADPFPYMLADVIVEGPSNPEDVHIYLHDDGELFFFLLDEGRRFVVASGPKGSELGEPPTLETMQEIVSRRTQGSFRLSDPRWLTNFHIQYRLAPHYRHGRTFLAGDAAHIHSLIGGHGMNTGIQDAHNLAWKLALVLKGVVPASWLDSYEIERRRVAEDVLAMTRSATERTELFPELSPHDRAKLCEHMFVAESQKAQARRHAEGLDLDYRSSPLCVEAEGEFEAGPHAGARAPDVEPLIVGGSQRRLFELLRGTKHRLLLFAGSPQTATEDELAAGAARVTARHAHWIDVFVIREQPVGAAATPDVVCVADPSGSLHERYGAGQAGAYLIRPDGYVAYRSRRLDGLDRYLDRVL